MAHESVFTHLSQITVFVFQQVFILIKKLVKNVSSKTGKQTGEKKTWYQFSCTWGGLLDLRLTKTTSVTIDSWSSCTRSPVCLFKSISSGNTRARKTNKLEQPQPHSELCWMMWNAAFWCCWPATTLRVNHYGQVTGLPVSGAIIIGSSSLILLLILIFQFINLNNLNNKCASLCSILPSSSVMWHAAKTRFAC